MMAEYRGVFQDWYTKMCRFYEYLVLKISSRWLLLSLYLRIIFRLSRVIISKTVQMLRTSDEDKNPYARKKDYYYIRWDNAYGKKNNFSQNHSNQNNNLPKANFHADNDGFPVRILESGVNGVTVSLDVHLINKQQLNSSIGCQFGQLAVSDQESVK